VQLLFAIEQLPSSTGPRLAAQWEYLGMLQSLALVWAMTAIGLSVGYVISRVLPWQPLGTVPTATGWAIPLICAALLFLATGVTYSFRNRGLGRDLGASLVILSLRGELPVSEPLPQPEPTGPADLQLPAEISTSPRGPVAAGSSSSPQHPRKAPPQSSGQRFGRRR
jgi:hypothetical protein